MNKVFLGMIMSVAVISSIIGVDAVSPKDVIAAHVTNDNAYRVLQVFDIKSVEKGSQIQSVNAVFTLTESIGDECVLVLNEPHLNKDEISDSFICGATNEVPLKINGVHALQSKLNSGNFNIEIYSDNGLVNILSSDIELDISYIAPSYFAKVDNGIVINIILSNQTFIDSQDGVWVSSDKLVGVGFTYDEVNDVFTAPQPYPSWNLINNIWKSPNPSPGENYIWNESSLSWVDYNG